MEENLPWPKVCYRPVPPLWWLAMSHVPRHYTGVLDKLRTLGVNGSSSKERQITSDWGPLTLGWDLNALSIARLGVDLDVSIRTAADRIQYFKLASDWNGPIGVKYVDALSNSFIAEGKDRDRVDKASSRLI
jgi:hypothetical protein